MKDEDKKVTDVVPLKEMITIPRAQYERLIEDQLFLEALKSQGVDNWECGGWHTGS